MDIIKDDFWDQRPWILTGTAGIPHNSNDENNSNNSNKNSTQTG